MISMLPILALPQLGDASHARGEIGDGYDSIRWYLLVLHAYRGPCGVSAVGSKRGVGGLNKVLQ